MEINVNEEKSNLMTLPAGCLLNENRYEINNVIGVGGFGITYEAFDVYNKERCAIKELFIHNSVIRDENGVAVLPLKGKEKVFQHGIDQFMGEAETLKKLNGTANVVVITDYFKQNNTAYFVMNYIDGDKLNGEMTKHGGKIPFGEAVYIMTKVGYALHYIHKKYRILHRDISPENIMLDEKYEPMLIDFGNAKNYVRNEDEGGTIILKPNYAPLEQYSSAGQGTWTDVYAFAAVFYYIVTGKKLPTSKQREEGEMYVPLHEIEPSCSVHLSGIIDKALELQPEKRIQTLEKILNAFPMVRKTDKGKEKKKVVYVDSGIIMPYLSVTEKGQAVMTWMLPVDENVIFGKDSRYSNIVISGDKSISRQHCIISFDSAERRFVVVDISRNGIRIEGSNTKLEREREYKFKPGDKLVVGTGRYLLEFGVQNDN